MSGCQQVASRLQACYIIAGEDSVYGVYVYDYLSTYFSSSNLRCHRRYLFLFVVQAVCACCFWPWLTAAGWQGWCFRRLRAWSTVFHLQPLKTWVLVLWTLRSSDSFNLNKQRISKEASSCLSPTSLLLKHYTEDVDVAFIFSNPAGIRPRLNI